MAVKQDIDIPVIATVGLIGAMVLLMTIWGIEAWYGYETDFVRSQRYAADKNRDWIALRDEQYDNLGDDIGNSTIYAHPPLPSVGRGELLPYRWLGEDRSRAAIPIHEAMAAVVNQNGGNVTAARMRELDKAYAPSANKLFAVDIIRAGAAVGPTDGSGGAAEPEQRVAPAH